MTDPERSSLLSRLESVFDQEIRPSLGGEGMQLELVGVDDDYIVQIRMGGACQSCPATAMSLIMGMESAIKAVVPEIRFVEAVP